MNERNTDGTFAAGNSAGRGRPRRAVELEYLAAVADACRLERWARIVEAACVAAEAGDDKARQWLSKYLLGADPPTLFALARRDTAGVTPDAELAAQLAVDTLTLSERLSQFGFGPDLTAFETAASAARTADDVPAGVRDSLERLRKKARTAA